MTAAARHLVLVPGDQLNADSAAFDGYRPESHAVLMAEVAEEALYVPQHRRRLVLFVSAMGHFRDDLRQRGWTVHSPGLDGPANSGSLGGEVRRWLAATGASRLVLAKPGDYRVESMVRERPPPGGLAV